MDSQETPPTLFAFLSASFDLLSEHMTSATETKIHKETSILIIEVIEQVLHQTSEIRGFRRCNLKLAWLLIAKLNLVSIDTVGLVKLATEILLEISQVESLMKRYDEILEIVDNLKRTSGWEVRLNHRSRLCKHGASCPYGDSCKFPHLQSQFMLSRAIMLCKYYFELGFCPYGSYCYNSHKAPADNRLKDGQEVTNGNDN